MARRTGMVMKDEGLIFSLLKCLRLEEARKLCDVSRTFFKVLDGKVIPLVAVRERDWSTVSHYMDVSSDGWLDGLAHPRFEYNYDSIAVQAIIHQDFVGLQLLASRQYDFASIHRNARLASFVRDALCEGSVEKLCMFRSIGLEYEETLAECLAQDDLAQFLHEMKAITIDFFGTRLIYQSSVLDFASKDAVDCHLRCLCARRERLFRVPFVMAAFMCAGASPCSFMRPDRCGYLLLLALASESFNFVYLLVKEAIFLEAIFEHYHDQLELMIKRSIDQDRFSVLELIAFCGFKLRPGEAEQCQFDSVILRGLEKGDFLMIECLCSLGFSFASFAERNAEVFHAFVQSHFDQPLATAKVSPESAGYIQPTLQVHPVIRRMVKLDKRALELHFRSRIFLDFVADLVAKKSFMVLQQIVQVHPHAMQPYFAENYCTLESLLVNAFHTRDSAFIVDMSLLAFPMRRFFKRHRVELDRVILSWLQSKSWMELSMLKNETSLSHFPALFERNRDHSDAFVLRMLKDGYWFDLHNLRSLSFDFQGFFERRFTEVSEVVLSFIAVPQPHFVLLRELSALSFPWTKFMDAHHNKILAVKDSDFLHFVMSLEGFEVGSKVYDIVEQTCCLYHSMAASMFDSMASASRQRSENAEGQLDGTGATAEGPSLSSAEPFESISTCPVKMQASSAGSASSSGFQGSDPHHHRNQVLPSSSSSSSVIPSSLPRPRYRPRILASDASRIAASRIELSRAEGEEALSLHQDRLAELVRKSHEKELETKQVLVLLIRKGAYCWNPLNLGIHDAAPKPAPHEPLRSPDVIGSRPAFSNELRQRAWLHVEGVRNFLDAVDDAWMPISGINAQNIGNAGLAAPAPHPPAFAGAAGWGANAAAVLAGGAAAVQAMAPLHVPGPFPPLPLGAPAPVRDNSNGRPVVALHVACLAQPGELFFFRSNLDLFWDGILDTDASIFCRKCIVFWFSR
jgi:hypothetical protein